MHWLTTSWYNDLPAPWSHILISLAAVLSGTIIGTEREKREKPAGLRTLILVCVGAASFTMVSYAFGTTTGDTGRVAAQVVTGIGFLGTGVILHGKTAVSGVTTAATIWATAAVGMIAGVGYVPAGIGSSVLIRAVLNWMYWLEHEARGQKERGEIELLINHDGGKTLIRLHCLLQEFRVKNQAREVGHFADGKITCTFEYELSHNQSREFLTRLVELEGVEEIKRTNVQHQ